jgi:hypothetical protein
MKKTMQLTAAILLFISFATQADVNFTLTNDNAQPIVVMGYANNKILTLNNQPMRAQKVKTLKSDETLSINIANGQLNLIINVTGNNKKQYKYETSPTANNKDKILIWDGSQLYPASDKYNLMGIIKTKTIIGNNISIGELIRTE